jgi:hypothetical protein
MSADEATGGVANAAIVLKVWPMQDELELAGKLVGFVRVEVGGKSFNLAVQSLALEKDGDVRAGGFFAVDGQLGILIDESASPAEAKAVIEEAAAEALRHLSACVLN